jgi:hypothetical protein
MAVLRQFAMTEVLTYRITVPHHCLTKQAKANKKSTRCG